MELTFNERRVLGVLVEKGYTTPDQYPLTLNALVTGCNQKSCRNPVSHLDQDDVLEALDSLRLKNLCSQIQTAGGRTLRYRHLIKDALSISAIESAVIAELLLRGPQTDGELRQNAGRMIKLESLQALQETLESLAQREHPLLIRLGPDGRRRGVRVADTLRPAGELEALKESEAREISEDVPRRQAPPAAPPEERPALQEKVARLESEVAILKRRLARLEEEFGVRSEET